MNDGFIDNELADNLRSVIADSFDESLMIGAFVVIAENTDASSEQGLITWWNGGSEWLRLGMAEFFVERTRQKIGMDCDDD